MEQISNFIATTFSIVWNFVAKRINILDQVAFENFIKIQILTNHELNELIFNMRSKLIKSFRFKLNDKTLEKTVIKMLYNDFEVFSKIIIKLMYNYRHGRSVTCFSAYTSTILSVLTEIKNLGFICAVNGVFKEIYDDIRAGKTPAASDFN